LLLATSAARSVQHVPQAAWVAGLSAWRLDRKPEALRQFSAAFASPAASAWTRSAAAFWAARAADATRQPRLKLQWLERAADIGPTFYGLLARHSLDRPLVDDWSLPIIGVSEVQAFSQAPGFWRALALTQIDQVALAEAELRRAFPQAPRDLQPLALTIAERGGMPTLAMRLAQRIEHTHGVRYAAASFPVPPWMPSGGYQIDPALVFAIMRQESQFAPGARSHAGAQGLMQLMPGTARAMAGDPKLNTQALRDPQRNIGLGERLLDYLLSHERVRGNLLNLAVAYNGGEGTLARLQASVRHQDDPLLFLEAIPIAETRLFAERMIANYWIYQVRLAAEAPSIAEVGAGRWPGYRAPALVAQSNSRSPADARN
jgi:soluble lytic murein transglycosylase-like protein